MRGTGSGSCGVADREELARLGRLKAESAWRTIRGCGKRRRERNWYGATQHASGREKLVWHGTQHASVSALTQMI